MDYTKILIKPYITEKTTNLREEKNQVVFWVSKDANKIEVKKAVEEAFKVKVKKVNIVNVKPKVKKRFGQVIGRKRGWKKAYVTLEEGSKIDFFEGV